VDSLKRPQNPWANFNTVQLGKTGTDTNFLLLEIGCLSQRFAALTEQCWGELMKRTANVLGRAANRQAGPRPKAFWKLGRRTSASGAKFCLTTPAIEQAAAGSGMPKEASDLLRQAARRTPGEGFRVIP